MPIVVVGNKIDMPADERVVSAEEGNALAEEFGGDFIEISVSCLFTSVYLYGYSG